MRRRPKDRSFPVIGQNRTSPTAPAQPGLIIYTLIEGSPIFPAGIEGIEKTLNELAEVEEIPTLSAPISLPDHVGIAVDIRRVNNPDATRRLVLLDSRSTVQHDIWIGMRFTDIQSITLPFDQDNPDAGSQTFLIPLMVF